MTKYTRLVQDTRWQKGGKSYHKMSANRITEYMCNT